MKYETPELTALSPAINAIQSNPAVKVPVNQLGDNFASPAIPNEHQGGYMDWE